MKEPYFIYQKRGWSGESTQQIKCSLSLYISRKTTRSRYQAIREVM